MVGPTFVALLTAALLLPGIVAVQFFYRAGRTHEVDPVLPPLNSAQGIGAVGIGSILVHLVYATALWINAGIKPLVHLPVANPYAFLSGEAGGLSQAANAVALFAGLVFLCVLASAGGALAGWLIPRKMAAGIFYGPLANTIEAGRGDEATIIGYVLGRIDADGRQIGYQGIVRTLGRDADRFPTRVVLEDATIFYLTFRPSGPERREMPGPIPSIVLSASDWHNIAFRVFRLEESAATAPRPSHDPARPVPQA